MKIDIKFLNNLAQIPTRGSSEAAGYDLYAATAEPIVIPAHSTVKVGTGIAIATPKGYFAGLYARSGLATKQGLRPANCVGIVDSDYRGEVIVALHNDTDKPRVIEEGERIAQLIIQPCYDIDFNLVGSLDDTARGVGCFGSTGTN